MGQGAGEGQGSGHAYSSSPALRAVMKIKSSRQGMNQKPPDVSSTVTLEIGGVGRGLGPSLLSRLL